MKRETTMTIETRILLADDVFVENDVFMLSRKHYPESLTLSGVAWLRREPASRAHRSAILQAADEVERALPGHRLWLLGAHTAAQPTSAVTRRRRLWKSLELRGVVTPSGTRTEEYAISEEAGYRWFGAIEITESSFSEVLAVIEAEKASLLVALPDEAGSTVTTIIASGWSSSRHGPPRDVLEPIADAQGIVFWLVGAFDDVEGGLVAFASRRTIERLLRAVPC